jgi:hypothetical protein
LILTGVETGTLDLTLHFIERSSLALDRILTI